MGGDGGEFDGAVGVGKSLVGCGGPIKVTRPSESTELYKSCRGSQFSQVLPGRRNLVVSFCIHS